MPRSVPPAVCTSPSLHRVAGSSVLGVKSGATLSAGKGHGHRGALLAARGSKKDRSPGRTDIHGQGGERAFMHWTWAAPWKAPRCTGLGARLV